MAARTHPTAPALGLAGNWRQFSLLVLVTAFVGAMVGIERAVLPIMASREFGLSSVSVMLSFLVTFGIMKAGTNLATGWLATHFGRRRTLMSGWLLALPVPVILLLAETWGWIVFANALLGVSQGLTWSMTVVMKIDLVGPARRGLAMGLNEFAGYAALAITTVLSAMMASSIGMREGPAGLGIMIALSGFLLSAILVRDTAQHVELEESSLREVRPGAPSLRTVLRDSLWRDARLFSISQAGLVNNLNDGLAWGAFPLMLLGAGAGLRETGWLAAVYPATWGVCQVWTGALSDHLGRRSLIVAGMLLQGSALVGVALTESLTSWTACFVALGVGTALVYPSLLAAVGDIARPAARANAVGVYRMWRDLGYACGALLTGILTDRVGLPVTIASVGILTFASGVVFAFRYADPGSFREGMIVQPVPGAD